MGLNITISCSKMQLFFELPVHVAATCLYECRQLWYSVDLIVHIVSHLFVKVLICTVSVCSVAYV